MKKPRGCLPRLILLLCLLLVATGFWYFENFTLVTEEFTVESSALPSGFDGYKIVQISDLHGKNFGNRQEKLLTAVSEATPDLIAITGDLVDDESQIQDQLPLLTALTAIAPTYYISGNHEWSLDISQVWDILAKANVTALRNQFVPLTQNGQTILLAGFDDPQGPADQATVEEVMADLRQTHGDCYVVALYHRNDNLETFVGENVDLVLSGHGHGGVIRLPRIGGLIDTDRTLFPDFAGGLYTQNATQMVVSRGLGGNSGLDYRLFNRPHLPIITLKGK